jgi:ATP-dependent protease ClpP protease subunit
MTKTDPATDLDVLLLRERIVFVATPFEPERVIARLLYLDAVEPGEDVWLYLTGDGSDPAGTLALHDVLGAMRSPVRTLAVGDLGGSLAALLAAGSPGKRHVLPSARITWAPGERALELQAALGRQLPPGTPITAEQAVGFGLADAVWRRDAMLTS